MLLWLWHISTDQEHYIQTHSTGIRSITLHTHRSRSWLETRDPAQNVANQPEKKGRNFSIISFQMKNAGELKSYLLVITLTMYKIMIHSFLKAKLFYNFGQSVHPFVRTRQLAVFVNLGIMIFGIMILKNDIL